MNKTKNYNLTEWEPADQFDYNEINKDNSIIDRNLHDIKTEADTNKSNIEKEVSERKKAVIDSAHGGSGKTTLKESANAYIGSLDENSTDVVDDDSFITNDNDNTFYKRKALNVWNWIKTKISSVLGLTVSKYNGVSEKANNDKNGKDIPTEYSNKEYANNILNRYSTIVSIDYATTANIKLYGVQSIDGISIAPAKTVLVKNQSNAIENGIYESSNTGWKRRIAYDTDGELKHKLFKINYGNSNKDRVFYIPSEYFTVGKSNILFNEYEKIEKEQIADNTKQMIFDMFMPANKTVIPQWPGEPDPNVKYNGNGLVTKWEQVHDYDGMFPRISGGSISSTAFGKTGAEQLPNLVGGFSIWTPYTKEGAYGQNSIAVDGGGLFKTNGKVESQNFSQGSGYVDSPKEGGLTLNAHNYNSTYQDNGHVLPANFGINFWKRTK